jgi:glycosyltransferase involved in cell wall biosynthesis
MRIAYITEYDAADVHNWSGLGYFISRALEQQGFLLNKIGNLKSPPLQILNDKGKRFVHSLQGKKYMAGRDPNLARYFALQIQKHPDFSHTDIVFSPGSIPVSYLECRQPIVIYTDASFSAMLDFYPDYTNLCPESIKNGNAMEQSALDRCRLAIYSSEWAARSAITNYHISPDKIKIVPFGANIKNNPTSDDIKSIISSRNYAFCKLLFIGVDWIRKGGDIAVAITGQLTANGIPTELSVVGCTPKIKVPEYVKVYDFLSKVSDTDTRLLRRLFMESHFLVLPTRADASPVVISEASSYGIPSLVTNVGGISTLIREERNGKTFSPDTPIGEYVDYISKLWSHPDTYKELALSAFNEYQERLNWQSAGKAIQALLEIYCS